MPTALSIAPMFRPGTRRFGPGCGSPWWTDTGTQSFIVSGVSRDANGNALGGCTVMLFQTGTDQLAGKVVSELVTGAFAFAVPDQTTRYYAVFYLAGATDVAGTTVNSLTGA